MGRQASVLERANLIWLRWATRKVQKISNLERHIRTQKSLVLNETRQCLYNEQKMTGKETIMIFKVPSKHSYERTEENCEELESKK
jgi:hypothetical protein